MHALCQHMHVANEGPHGYVSVTDILLEHPGQSRNIQDSPGFNSSVPDESCAQGRI